MRLTQLEFLVALDKFGSFSRVAQELFVSQPSISAAIKNLEEELGYAILKRSNKGVVFTNEGKLVLEKAREIMRDIEDIKKIEHTVDGNLQGKVYVAAESFYSSTLLLDAVMAVKRQYPGPKLSILIGQDDSNELIRSVADGVVDLALILCNDVNQEALLADIERGKLRFHHLFDDQMLFIAAKNHPLLSQPRIRVQDLFAYRFASYKQSLACAVQQKLAPFGLSQGFQNGLIKFNDTDSIKRFILQTDAFTAVPGSVLDIDASYADRFAPFVIPDFQWRCFVGWIHSKEPVTTAEEKIIHALAAACPLPPAQSDILDE